jgi:hypothetical protein
VGGNQWFRGICCLFVTWRSRLPQNVDVGTSHKVVLLLPTKPAITSRSPIWGKVSMGGYLPHINRRGRSGKMWEAAVRGATSRLHPTAGDFHRQGNPAEVTPVGQ